MDIAKGRFLLERWREREGGRILDGVKLMDIVVSRIRLWKNQPGGGVYNASFPWMKVVSLHFLETGVINKLFTPSRSPKHTRLSAPPEEEGLGGGWWKRRAGLETNLASIHY